MRDRESIREATSLLQRAVHDRVFPGAAVEVGDSRAPLWHHEVGGFDFDPDSPRVDRGTIFDLASLTKPLATTSVVLQLVADRVIGLGDPLSSRFAEWRGDDRKAATIQDLLEHAAGLPARLLDAPPLTKREFEHEICAMPLEYEPRARSIYSDLGFILLGILAEAKGTQSLAQQFAVVDARVAAALEATIGADALTFGVADADRIRTAPTLPLEDDPRRGRALSGEVHDVYAAALGGISGHAGLFGTARGVGRFARGVLRGARGDQTMPVPLSPDLVARATTKTTVEGSSRALGWDTMRPTSSCGTRLSSAAFGHVGFTGTSLWIDPASDRYFVLLTNRAGGGGTTDEMQQIRRRFHDTVAPLGHPAA